MKQLTFILSFCMIALCLNGQANADENISKEVNISKDQIELTDTIKIAVPANAFLEKTKITIIKRPENDNFESFEIGNEDGSFTKATFKSFLEDDIGYEDSDNKDRIHYFIQVKIGKNLPKKDLIFRIKVPAEIVSKNSPKANFRLLALTDFSNENEHIIEFDKIDTTSLQTDGYIETYISPDDFVKLDNHYEMVLTIAIIPFTK